MVKVNSYRVGISNNLKKNEYIIKLMIKEELDQEIW